MSKLELTITIIETELADRHDMLFYDAKNEIVYVNTSHPKYKEFTSEEKEKYIRWLSEAILTPSERQGLSEDK